MCNCQLSFHRRSLGGCIRSALADERIDVMDMVRLSYLGNRFELLQPWCMVIDEDTLESKAKLPTYFSMSPTGKL